MSELEKIGMPSPYAEIEHLRSQLEKAKAALETIFKLDHKKHSDGSTEVWACGLVAYNVLKDLTQKGPSDE